MHTPSIDLRLLSGFRILGRELHFARAASLLNMAQPTLTQQIRRLERQLGFELFTRTSRRVELTPAGRVLLAGTEEGLDRIEAGISSARAVAHRPATLRVAVEWEVEEAWLAGVRAFAAARRSPRVTVTRGNGPEVVGELREGRADAALHWLPPELSGLPSVRMGGVEALIVMADDHPLAACPAVTHEQVREHTFVLWERSDGPEWWDYFAGLLSGGDPGSFRAIGVSSVDSAQRPMLAAIPGTDRLTMLTPGFWAVADTRGLVCRPFTEPVVIPMYWSWPAGGERPEAQALRAFLAQQPPVTG